MTDHTITSDERQRIESAVARLRAGILAIVFGMVGGTGLFVATAWLLIKGGPNVGATLGLLGNYLPGYAVTWPGAHERNRQSSRPRTKARKRCASAAACGSWTW